MLRCSYSLNIPTDVASVYSPIHYFLYDIMYQERLRVIFTAFKVAIKFLEGTYFFLRI